MLRKKGYKPDMKEGADQTISESITSRPRGKEILCVQ